MRRSATPSQPDPSAPWGEPPAAPEPPKRSWFARHKILTGVLGVVAIGVLAAALGGGDGEPSSTPTPPAAAVGSPTDAGSPADSQDPGEPAPATEAVGGSEAPGVPEASDAPEEEPAVQEPVTAAIGDAVEVGDFTVTVTGIEAGIERVGNEYFGDEAQGQFVKVNLAVTNNGDSAEHFLDSLQKLMDEQGREHSSSSSVIYLEDENLMATQINPGNTAEGSLLYDIPADAVPAVLKLAGGFFGGDVEVALR
ncbi:MAG: DUF4352 domain-containing protein [bacterium]|nr:DUF4352 domain-containing protein [bacterium]